MSLIRCVCRVQRDENGVRRDFFEQSEEKSSKTGQLKDGQSLIPSRSLLFIWLEFAQPSIASFTFWTIN